MPATPTTGSPARTRRTARLARALLAALLGAGLVPPAGARGADAACTPAFRAPGVVWYQVETLSREPRTFDSGCTRAAGALGEVGYYVRGGRIVIACDLPLALPSALQAALAEAQRLDAAGPPSRRRDLDRVWGALVRRFDAALTCGAGFERMRSAAGALPSVWCRRMLSARELCPQPGGTYAEGACHTSTCPAGTVDLAATTDGKLSGCARCPAGRIDLAESLAWTDPAWARAAAHGPATSFLCKARESEPCPAAAR